MRRNGRYRKQTCDAGKAGLTAAISLPPVRSVALAAGLRPQLNGTDCRLPGAAASKGLP
jgi:hypothetical protein